MKALYEPYPEDVVVKGRLYPVVTDFREWIKFHDMMRDPEVTQHELAYGMMQYYEADVPTDSNDAVCGVVSFYLRKDPEETYGILFPQSKTDITKKPEEKKKPLYDYGFDADCIAAGFYYAYRIDLDTVRYLHWHKFHALLDHLPEDTEFRQRIHYRGIDAGKIKDKKERERVRKIQRQIRIPAPAPTVNEIGGLFW